MASKAEPKSKANSKDTPKRKSANAKEASSRQLAALDLGSNSFHLIVVKESNGHIQVLDRHKEMVRLAEGLVEGGKLLPDVEQRALACLERLGQRLRGIEADNVRVVGTNALRLAKNAKQFIKRGEQLLGHEIEIIRGREEARLVYLGVSHSVQDSATRRLVVDIGGGSTELIVGKHFQARVMESLTMGCVSMSLACFKNGKITSGAWSKANSLAKQELEPIMQQFQESDWDTAIGASGTIVAIQEILSNLNEGEVITPAGLESLQRRLIDTGDVSKIDLPGLSSERQPVFCGGVAILQAVFEALDVQEMQSCSGALREGLIYDLLGRVRRHDVREASIANLCERYHVDIEHATRVSELALDCYSQVKDAWPIDQAAYPLLLRWACFVHEIGMDISHSQYHKHGEYLLSNMDLPGFSQSDQRRLALLTRCHRRKIPPELTEAEPVAIRYLAVLLRLSIALRRGRGNAASPKVKLAASEQGLVVNIAEKWLQKHPLTKLDLEVEQKYLEALPLRLEIETV